MRKHRSSAMEGWLDEYILCGWPYPISRRQALQEMLNEGITVEDAINALCWYSAVDTPHSITKDNL